jgi:hypothetical protein
MSKNGLNTIQAYKLMDLMQKEYVSSKKNDKDFAAYASQVLGFFVSDNHVGIRRRMANIKSNYIATSEEVKVKMANARAIKAANDAERKAAREAAKNMATKPQSTNEATVLSRLVKLEQNIEKLFELYYGLERRVVEDEKKINGTSLALPSREEMQARQAALEANFNIKP